MAVGSEPAVARASIELSDELDAAGRLQTHSAVCLVDRFDVVVRQ